MKGIKAAKKEIQMIKERNRRVEADKACETSWFRRIIISILTYFVIVILFYMAGLQKPWINSIVPAVAFILSTMSLRYLKKMWLKHFYGK